MSRRFTCLQRNVRLEVGRWTLAASHAAEESVRVDPFGEVEIGLGRWWLDA